MKKNVLFKYSFIFLIFIFAGGVYAMSLTDVGKVCLFSKISGVITLNGQPVVNAKLVRTVDRDGGKSDETTTDGKGYFELPSVFERTITKFLPQEFVVSQKIHVHYEGKEYEIWSAVKRSPDEKTESRGKPLVVQCDLTNERKLIIVDRSPIFSLCKWDVEPDPKEEFF